MYFYIECTWWRLLQKHSVHTLLYIYMLIEHLHTCFMPYLLHYVKCNEEIYTSIDKNWMVVKNGTEDAE